MGSSMEASTDEKSSEANSFILPNMRGMNNENIVANTTHITMSVIVAAHQRGRCRPRKLSSESLFTSGRPMMASTADTSMYMTTALKNHMR